MKRLNILLIGSSNSLSHQLIRQFSKEGHRISLLTGSDHREQSYPRVFERYDFSYTSEAIPEVFTSVAPDVTVFTGAYDGNFLWEDERRDAVRYVSAVMNILSAYAAAGKGRLIYLSSDSVYAAQEGVRYAEDDAADAADLRGAALVQAEDICRRFMADANADIIIARLSGCYHLPKNREDVDDALSEFCVKYLRDGNVPLPDEQTLIPLSEADAVFFLSRLALAPAHRHSVYHIAADREVRVEALKKLIAAAAEEAGYRIPAGGPAAAAAGSSLAERIQRRQERRGGGRETFPGRKRPMRFARLRYPQAALDASRFREEFGINKLADFEGDLRAIVAHMVRGKAEFLSVGAGHTSLLALLKEKSGWLFRALVPFLENVVCFVLFFLLNMRLDGSRYFARIDFYLIYVLLFAILYGQHQAILSAFLASAGFLFVQLRGSAGGGVLLDYNTYVWIAELFILGLVVGYLKDRLSDQKSEAVQDYEHMNRQIDDMREINESNVRVKDALQTQIINQNDSIGKIYEITSTLDEYSSEDVFFHAMDILRQIMGSDDIALYTVPQGDYARLFSATSELASSLGNSICYREIPELYDVLKEGKPYINRALRQDLPVMACAIREGEEIRNIIMIWQLPWEKLTLGQAGILTVTSMLIQGAVLRAQKFLEMRRDERIIEGTRILKPEAFSSVLESYKNAAAQRLTRFTLLRIAAGGKDGDAVETGKRASDYLRQDDYLGLGKDGHLYVLLPNTSLKNAGVAVSRLAEGGIRTEAAAMKNEETA